MDEPKKDYVTNEQAQRTTTIVGFVILAIGAIAAYFIWPSGIGDVPLASLTLGMLAKAAGSVVVLLVPIGIAGALWN
jgi:hypothetical protein